jgi:magnesium transporter
MTNDFVCVQNSLSVKQAMRSVISQAGEKDNISTIFVTDESGVYLGAIRLRDLVIARAETPLEEVIIKSFPFLYASAQIEESLWALKEYAEPSLPILNDDNRLIGALTSADTIEALDEELTDDYARLAGLTEEDLEDALEKKQIFSGALKRLPWLIVLLVLDLFIGMYIGIFEAVVIGLPFLVSFQQLVSGMSGNTGTQTLASAINLLSDNADDGKKQREFLFNEFKIGLCIGLITGIISFIAVSLYAYLTSATGSFLTDLNTGFAVGLAMMLSTTVASVTGALIPITLNKLKVDPAVASGPLITTLNDLIAITVYYGFALLLLL